MPVLSEPSSPESEVSGRGQRIMPHTSSTDTRVKRSKMTESIHARLYLIKGWQDHSPQVICIVLRRADKCITAMLREVGYVKCSLLKIYKSIVYGREVVSITDSLAMSVIQFRSVMNKCVLNFLPFLHRNVCLLITAITGGQRFDRNILLFLRKAPSWMPYVQDDRRDPAGHAVQANE